MKANRLDIYSLVSSKMIEFPKDSFTWDAAVNSLWTRSQSLANDVFYLILDFE